MSEQATLSMGGAFVDDSAARTEFLAVQRRLRWRKRLLPLAAVLALLLIWWQSIEIFGIRPFIAPSPVAVGEVLVSRFDMLMENLLPTSIEAVLGFLLGNFAGIAIATAFVYSRTMEEAFFPIAVMINTIPVVAKAPILVLLMGNGMEPKITIAALICFFPTLVNMVRGLEAVNPQSMELMRVLSASKSEVYFKLRLYNSLPYLFSALKIATSTSVIGAVVGEWIGSTRGIGALIIQATYSFDSALLYSAVIMSSLLAGAFFLLITLIERTVVKWQPASAP